MRRSEARPAGARHGVVLVLALLALVVLELLAAGFLFVATQESMVADAWTRHVRVRMAAEGMLRLAAATWSASAHSALAVGERVTFLAGTTTDDVAYEVQAERLAANHFRLRSRAVLAGADSTAPGAAAVAALRVRGLLASELLRGMPGAVTAHGTVHLTGGVMVDPVDPAPPACAEPVPPASAAVVADSTGAIVVEDALLGEPAVIAGDSADMIAGPLGSLSWGAVEGAAEVHAAGTIHLQHAVLNGECVTGADGNWGSPLDPGGPCGGYFPLIYAPGDLTVSGGAGQGVLIVRGNLTLGAGVRFHGPIVVGGAIDSEDAEIDGALRVGAVAPGAASRLDGGALRYRRCMLVDAIAGSALDGAFRPGPRLWIPAFE